MGVPRWEARGRRDARRGARQGTTRRELGLELERVGAVLFRSPDLDAPFDICFVEVSARGIPRALEHVDLEWYDRSRIMELDLSPADRRFVVERLAAHGHSAVT